MIIQIAIKEGSIAMDEKQKKSTFDELMQALTVILYLIYFTACAAVAILDSLVAGLLLASVGACILFFLWSSFGEQK